MTQRKYGNSSFEQIAGKVYDTNVKPTRHDNGRWDLPGYYAVSQYGYDLAGPFELEEQAAAAVLQYIEHHLASSPETGKPVLVDVD